jgi:signal transduction histidine kinase
VIRDDAEMDDALRAVVAATTEALNNAARHSGVNQIDLFSEIHQGEARVNVRDRGVGFDPATVSGSGMADSIVNRIQSAGGSAEVRSAPGRGTEVEIRVPLS